MSDVDILPCYPIPSVFQCKDRESIALLLFILIFGIFIMFSLIISIRKFIAEKSELNRRITSFFLLCVYGCFGLVTNFFMDSNCAYTNAIYCAQSVPRAFYCISQCMLAEQTASILIMLKIKFSKILKYAIHIMYYVFIVASIAIAFICISVPFENPVVRLNFISSYVNPFISYAYLIVHALTIVINAIAFVFLPSIYELFHKKFIKLMRILLFLCSFFFLCFYIVFIYDDSVCPFDRVLIIDHGTKIYVLSSAIQNLLAEYIPKIIYSTMMWYMTYEISKHDETEEHSQGDENDNQVVNQSLVELDNDKYYFPE